MKRSGIRLKMSTSLHPQTDGSFEIINRLVKSYQRCYCSYNQDGWDLFLPTAEFAYNSALSENIEMSSFEIDSGWYPKTPLSLISGKEVTVESMNDFKKNYKSSLDGAQFCYRIAKERQSAKSSHRKNDPSHVVGSRSWINKSLFQNDCYKSHD